MFGSNLDRGDGGDGGGRGGTRTASSKEEEATGREGEPRKGAGR